MKNIRIVFVVLFASLILMGVVFANYQKKCKSELHKRYLVEIECDSIEKLPSQVNSYIKDRLGLSELYWFFNDNYKFYCFDIIDYAWYCKGSNGEVFLALSYTNYPTWKEFCYEFSAYLARIQKFCNDRGAYFVYILQPAKNTIYPQYLPESYPSKDLDIYQNELIKCLNDNKINFVNNIDFLKKYANEPIFKKEIDPGHWTDLGCFYGTNNMLSRIQEKFPSVKLHTLDDFKDSIRFDIFLGASKIIVNETINLLKEKGEKWEKYKPYYHYLNKIKYSNIKIHHKHKKFNLYHNDIDNNINCLFFHGSYYHTFRHFYNDRFADITAVHNYENLLNFDYYYNIFGADLVIVETAEYTTTDRFFNLEKMKNKFFNLPYDSLKNQEHKQYLLKDIENAIIDHKYYRDYVDIMIPKFDSCKFGYLLSNQNDFDLNFDGDTISVTINSKYYNDSLKICLFN